MADECCPKFNVEKWENKVFNWKDKPFITETVPTLFHVPFPPMIGQKITKMWKSAGSAGQVGMPKEDILILFADPTPFKSEILLSVTGEVPGANNKKLTGNFVSRVFDGGFNAAPKFIKEMEAYLQGKGQKAKNYYFHYAYCPKCVKKFGHNYQVLFAEI